MANTLTKPEASPKPQFESTAPAQLTAMWAASMFIGQSFIQHLIFLSSGTINWVGLRAVLIGLHLCIWILGTTVAFLKHRDLRVTACLIGIAVVLPIVGPWLPRFILLAVSIGFLLFSIVRQVFVPSRAKSGKTPAERNVDGTEIGEGQLQKRKQVKEKKGLMLVQNDNHRPSSPSKSSLFAPCRVFARSASSVSRFVLAKRCMKASGDQHWGWP